MSPDTSAASEPPIADFVARIHATSEAMVGLRPAIEAGEPWPLAEHFGIEPEAHWGPREVLAHCDEMLPFWIGEMERILAGTEPVPFGRISTDVVRVATIERDLSLIHI